MMSVDSPSAVHYSNEFTPFRPKNKRRHNETLEDQEGMATSKYLTVSFKVFNFFFNFRAFTKRKQAYQA